MEEMAKMYRLDKLFSYKDAMDHLGYTQEDITKVRDIIEKDELMPKFILNSQVNLFFYF